MLFQCAVNLIKVFECYNDRCVFCVLQSFLKCDIQTMPPPLKTLCNIGCTL